MEILIHITSLMLALAAAFESLRLIHLTGRNRAWLYLCLGFALLAGERMLELFSGQASSSNYSLHELTSDLLMLAMAALYLVGIRGMRAVFPEHRAAEQALQHELDDLKRFERLTVGRELRMKELTEENSALQHQIENLPHRRAI